MLAPANQSLCQQNLSDKMALRKILPEAGII
jgi:hypothetical protein